MVGSMSGNLCAMLKKQVIYMQEIDFALSNIEKTTIYHRKYDFKALSITKGTYYCKSLQ